MHAHTHHHTGRSIRNDANTMGGVGAGLDVGSGCHRILHVEQMPSLCSVVVQLRCVRVFVCLCACVYVGKRVLFLYFIVHTHSLIHTRAQRTHRSECQL